MDSILLSLDKEFYKYILEWEYINREKKPIVYQLEKPNMNAPIRKTAVKIIPDNRNTSKFNINKEESYFINKDNIEICISNMYLRELNPERDEFFFRRLFLTKEFQKQNTRLQNLIRYSLYDYLNEKFGQLYGGFIIGKMMPDVATIINNYNLFLNKQKHNVNSFLFFYKPKSNRGISICSGSVKLFFRERRENNANNRKQKISFKKKRNRKRNF